MTDQVRAVLRDKRLLLLDFDGPICSLYHGTAAAVVAAELTHLVQSPALRRQLARMTDPLEVLRITSGIDAGESAIVETALIAFELEAADSAAPTPGADALVLAAKRAGRKLGIVSNNSAGAIHRYLKRAQLEQHLDVIVGRPPGKPEVMKPSPTLLLRACVKADVSANDAAFIGDSVSDIAAARSAGMSCIGYANKPGKCQRLKDSDADVVVDSMMTIEVAIT